MSLRIGVLGGGQLGRMMALAGYPLNLSFTFYDKAADCPSAMLGERFGDDDYSPESLAAFIDSADVFTYEFENIPTAWVAEIAKHKPIYPGLKSLAVSQNRLNEKQLFSTLNIPSAAYVEVRQRDDLITAVQTLGLPLVVKTVTEGYDGKGQFLIREAEQVDTCWDQLGASCPLIAEEFVSFRRELSIIAVRSQDGKTQIYPLAENHHHRGILSHSVVPAPLLDENTQLTAERYISSILHELDHVGVLTLELFETRQGLMANETAPRVHNSGHWSIEGAHCSQFENHIRAVANLPLGNTRALQPTAMINIVGEHPDSQKILAIDDAHLHLYGKAERPARKLGHITVLAESYPELQQRMNRIAESLPNPMALPPSR